MNTQQNKGMRKVFCAIVALLPLLATAQTHVLFTLSEFNASPTTNRTVTVQALTPFRGNLISYSSSTNGYFYISNMAVGDYDCVILKKGSASEIAFQVTVTSAALGVINAASNTSVRGVQTYPVSGKSAWTILASEARYGAASIADGTLTTNKIDTTFREWVIEQSSGGAGISSATATNIVDAKFATVAPLTNNEARAVTFVGGPLTVGNGTGSNVFNLNGDQGFVGVQGAGFVFSDTDSTITVPSGVSLIADGAELSNLDADNIAAGTVALARLPSSVITNNNAVSNRFFGAFTGNAASLTNINAGNFTNVMYVSPTGNDSNSGASWGEAKKTLLAAYDAVTYCGIIHFANNSTVGGATNQGLWFMSSGDPNFGQPGYPSATNAVGTNGWRTAKYIKWVGESSSLSATASFGHPGNAIIIPGTGGTWARSTNNPAIWLSGADEMTFHNVTIGSAAICVRAGISSTGSAISTARLKFENCQFTIAQEGSGDDGNLGQCFDFGSVFWVDILDCVLLGSVSVDIPVTSDRRAVILCRPPAPGDLSSFLINIERNVWSGGGLKYYPGSGYGIVTMSHVIAEAAYTQTAPIFWVVGSHGNLYARITDCDTADASLPAGMQTVQIDSDTDLYSGNIVVDHGKVNGPATIIGSYAQEGKTNNLHAKKQMGFSDGSVWGSTDAFRRNYAPTFVPYTNIVSGALPADAAWVTGPNGMTNAVTGTSTSSGIQSFRLQTTSLPLAVGDWILFGTWMRVTNGYFQNGSVGQCFLTINAGNKFRNGLSALSAVPKFHHDGWQWLWNFNQITNASVSPDSIYTTVNYYTNSPIEVWNPTVIRIPAGEMTENDVAELATHMSGWPATVAAGSVAMQKFQRLAMWDAGSNAFNYLDLDSGRPRVTQADGTVLAPYLNGTNIIASTINSNKLDAATLALLGAGGGGGSVTNLTNNTGLPGLLVGSGLGTNLASLVAKTNPVISGTLTLDNGSGYRTVGAENVTNTYIAAQQGRVILEGQQGVELRGGITGSGSGLTNITAHTAIVSGTISNAQIAASTINSNRFDADTLAKLYEASGSGTTYSNLLEAGYTLNVRSNLTVGLNQTNTGLLNVLGSIHVQNYIYALNGNLLFWLNGSKFGLGAISTVYDLDLYSRNELAARFDYKKVYFSSSITATNGALINSNSWPFIATNTLANGQLAIGSSNGTFTVVQKNQAGVQTTNQFTASGGSQTPWLSTIDGGGYYLTNAGWVSAATATIGMAELTNTYLHLSNGFPSAGLVATLGSGLVTNAAGVSATVGSLTTPSATITTANIETNITTDMTVTNFVVLNPWDAANATNLTYNLRTNAINTGIIPVGKTTFTNITGAITIAGLSGVDLNFNQWAKLWVTNSTATDYAVTLAAPFCTATNAFVVAQAIWVTNKSAVTINIDVSAWGTNAAAVRFQR